MNIRQMHEILSHIEEIMVIGKKAGVDGVTCNVMGLVRHGAELRLLILQYDENFRQMIEEYEAVEQPENLRRPETNRVLMRGDRRIDALNPFQSVAKVFIGKSEYRVNGSEHRRLSAQDWESLLVIARFLDNGWEPNDVDYQNVDMLFLTSLTLDGDYDAIPAFDPDSEMRFIMRPHSVVHQVEKPITLTVGADYPDKITFQDAATGAEHWVQINRVYLSDFWGEMEKTFTDPKLQAQMTPEEIAQARSDFEKRFMAVCPRGMYLPVIEYECDDNIFLQFYSRSFLDAKPVATGSSMAFMVQPSNPTGILGLKLRAAVIQEPVPVNTKAIEAELFQAVYSAAGGDIVL